MKRLLSFVLVLTMLATMFVGVTAVQADATATIALVGATVDSNGQFDVKITLQNDADLLSGQIGIKYDADKLTVVDYSVSEYIAALGNDANVANGMIKVMFDATEATSFATAKDVATVKFQVAAGVDYSTVGFSIDGDYTEIATAPDYAVAAYNFDTTGFVLADEVCLHESTREEVVSNATCTAAGSKNIICNKCGEVVGTEEIPVLDHTESEWIVDKEATTDDPGSQHKECTVCGTVIATESIPMLEEEGIILKGYGEYGPGVLHKFYDDGRLVLIGKEEGAYTYDFSAKEPNPIKKAYKNAQVMSISVTGIKRLGNRAFHNFSYAKELTIDETIEEFGTWALAYCNNIINVTIDGKIKSIGNGNFYLTTKIKNWKVPNTTKAEYDAIVLGDASNPWYNAYTVVTKENNKYGVFRGNDVDTAAPQILFNWSIIDGVMKLEGAGEIPNVLKDQAPWNEYRAEPTELILPEGITRIGQYVFRGFNGVKNIRIPASVKSIGNYAFWSVGGIESMTLYNTLTQFEGTSEINPGTGRTYTLNFVGSKDEFNAIPNSNKLSSANVVYSTVQSEGTTGDVAWTLDNHGVLKVTGEGAMADYASAADAPWAASADSIKEVMIGDDVTTVGANAFAGLANLENIVLGKNTKYVNDGAFAGVNVANVAAYDRLFEIREGAFAGSTVDTFAYFGTLGAYNAIAIYKNNDAVKNAKRSLVTPVERNVVMSGDFTDNIKYTVYDDGVLVLSGNGKGVANLSSSAPAPWTADLDVRKSIKYAVVERGITHIYQRTFDRLSNLEAVYLGNTLTTLSGNNVFLNCTSLNTLYMSAVTSITATAFSGTTPTKVIYGGSSNSAFSGVTGLADSTWVYCK